MGRFFFWTPNPHCISTAHVKGYVGKHMLCSQLEKKCYRNPVKEFLKNLCTNANSLLKSRAISQIFKICWKFYKEKNTNKRKVEPNNEIIWMKGVKGHKWRKRYEFRKIYESKRDNMVHYQSLCDALPVSEHVWKFSISGTPANYFALEDKNSWKYHNYIMENLGVLQYK